MTSVFSRAALLAGVMTFGLSASALAADAPPGEGRKEERRVVIMRGPGGGGMHPPGMMMMHGMDPEKHAQHLRDVLQLRPDQEGALKAFIAAMTPPEHPHPMGADGDAPPKPATTPERLAMAEKRMAEHQAMFQKHAAAIRAFYAQLTPAQQKAFDALHPGGGRIHMRRGPGGPGGEHPPHHPGGPGGEAMIWEGEASPGGDAFFIDGPEDGAFEIELEVEPGR